ncbi:MAG TPA: hypothetical protein VGP52_13390 [Stellaceae bacterium]|jgi:hypothetical protein|nr:hypothetical protein [Stellaceae bacterium]
MRSLWRMIASRWLGGQGSQALTDDSGLLDLLLAGESARARPAFRVSRQSAVSHQVLMARQEPDPANPEPVIIEKSESGSCE